MTRKKTPEPVGGGWYRLTDGSKVRGRAAAYTAAGLDPDRHGNRRSDAAKQRRRKPTIEERRTRVAAMFVQKVPYQEMARALDVALGTIASDIAALREQWRKDRSNDLDDYVIDELEVLDADEYRLRLAFNQASDPRIRMGIYDRIDKIRTNRRQLIGMDAPTVRRVIVDQDESEGLESGKVFRAGTDKESYMAALRAAQGLDYDQRHLRAVK